MQNDLAVAAAQDQVDARPLVITVEQQMGIRNDNSVDRRMGRNAVDVDRAMGMRAMGVGQHIGKFAG
jgi:hypothetical protein